MRLSIETTLFRPEQADPFFDSLQSYRDNRLWLSLGSSWLELEKAQNNRASENVPYNVVGACVPGEGNLPERVLRLFAQRCLPVEAGTASERKLPDVDHPIGTKALSFEMSRIYKKERGPSRETRGVLIQNVPLWRPQQLHAFSFWVNSYYDRFVEVGLSSGDKRAYLMLRKFSNEEDTPYVVAGCASEKMDIFEYLAGMFPLGPQRSPIRAYMTKSEHCEAWNFFAKPMPLDWFASAVACKYDELKR
jgi:hypothetical protein